jgi:phosphoglycerol transferase
VGARRWARELGWLVVAQCGTVVGVVVVLRLWRARWRVPFYSGADATLTAAWIKTVLLRGSYFDNPKLGFPTGANARDYPTGDLWHLVWLRIFALGSHDWALAMNVTYIGSFLLIAATAYVALRCLGVRPIVASGGAIVTSFLPYHFAHNETHLFLSDYSVIPLVVALAVAQLSDRPWFRLRRDVRVGWSRQVAAVAVVTWAAGIGGFYYAIMTAALLFLTAAFASVTRRRIEPALSALFLVAVLGVVVVGQLVPTLINDARHGRNYAFDRRLSGQDVYSLRPFLLIAPVDHYRVPAVSALTRNYETVSNPDETQALGFVAAAGIVGLLGAAAAPLVGRRRLRHPTDRALALVALTGLALGITAGGGELLALLGLTEIRDWNRISIFLGFVGVAAASRGLDRLITLRAFPSTTVVAIVLLCVTLAIFDQTSGSDTPPYRPVAAEFSIEGNFVRGIEHTVGANAAILQLPYTAYPESPAIVRMPEYSQMRGWLHSNTLRWSYGAIKGRPSWQDGQLALSLPDQLRRARRAGFAAVWVDRRGYKDNGVSIERRLRACLGSPILVESDQQRVLYDLAASVRC